MTFPDYAWLIRTALAMGREEIAKDLLEEAVKAGVSGTRLEALKRLIKTAETPS